MSNKIYLDYNATTPCDPKVVDAMLPYFYDHPGNAASRNHAFGWVAEEAVDKARTQLADLLQVDTKELVFTSGATEAINLAIKGVFEMYHRKGKHIITVETEHKAVLDTCRKIEKLGGEVTYLPVNQEGHIDLQQLREAIRDTTLLVSVMWANNETGLIHPMKAIGEICREKGVLFFSDATQAVGKIPAFPKECGVHLMACSAHKLYGPKGVGALFVNRRSPRVKLNAQLDGGGHENGMRSGTLNVPAIVGFGQAAAIAAKQMAQEAQRLAPLRDRLETQLLALLEEVQVNGSTTDRLPHVSNLSFRFVESEALLMTFNQQIAVSTGSACTSASLDPSHVLLAMGLSDDLAHASIRFSLGRFTSEAEVEETIRQLVRGVEQMRAISPVWEMFKEGRLD
ncbi:MAG: IscS subfamily cysteine desulfurase [Bacteroidota bacterium]